MVTYEQVETAFGESRKWTTPTTDRDCEAIALLRARIPYEVCKAIISCAEHDIIYLCNIEKAIPYLTEDDLKVLAMSIHIDEDCNSFAMFA